MANRLIIVGLLLGVFLTTRSDKVPSPPPSAGADETLDPLAAALKPLLIEALPEVLYEKSTNWGHQETAANGVRWKGLRPEVVKAPKNDGIWRRVRITTQELPRTLTLSATDFREVDAERQTFKVFLAFQAGVEYEQQNWDLGLRLWSGSVRARLQLKIALDCENILRVEEGKGLLPDITFRLRVTQAEVTYDNLVVEHLAGVGGSAARLTGEALRSSLKQWKPSLERDLLARANTAIVKAADTREVRIGLGGLVKKK
jgi:hypothetical protein